MLLNQVLLHHCWNGCMTEEESQELIDEGKSKLDKKFFNFFFFQPST